MQCAPMASAAASSGFAGSASNTVVSAVRASVWVRDDRENKESGRHAVASVSPMRMHVYFLLLRPPGVSCHLCCVHLSVRAPPRAGWHVDAGSGEFNLWMGATSGSTFNFLHVAKNKMYCM